MKILEVNKFYYPRRGAERHFLDVIELLKRRGHEVAVFAMRHPKNIQSSFATYFPSTVGYNAYDATLWQKIKGAGRLFWSFEAAKKMTALLDAWRPDVAHVHNIYHQLSPSLLPPIKARGIPIIMTVHDYNLVSPDKDVYYPTVGKSYWKFLFIRKYGLMKRILLVTKMYWQNGFRLYERYIDRYVVPSRFVRDVFISAGVPQEKLLVVPHFIEETVMDESLCHGEEIPKQAFALYLGSLSQEKSTDVLARMFDELRIPLVVAGSAEDNFTLLESSFVIPVGLRSKAEVQELIRSASCVVSASPLPETFGLIALEAISFGKPFFGLRSGAFAELIENGKNGYLAQNIHTLREYVADYFSGKHYFSAQDIEKNAHERFGAIRYAETFEHLCRTLIDVKATQLITRA